MREMERRSARPGDLGLLVNGLRFYLISEGLTEHVASSSNASAECMDAGAIMYIKTHRSAQSKNIPKPLSYR